MKPKLNLIITLALLVLPIKATAYNGYYYAGVSHTSQVAHYTTAIMQFDALPPSGCRVGCHVIAWTALAVPDGSAYVEAGVGCEPISGLACDRQWLWWANQKRYWMQPIGSVPLGTTVKVEITKTDGQNYALVKWSWPGGSKMKQVNLRKWYSGPGIHPTQLEVKVYNLAVFPHPILFQASGINIYPEDTSAYLYKQDPLYPVGDLTGFSVTVP